MRLYPVVLNSVIGDDKVPTFVLVYFNEQLSAVQCIGKPNSDDEESYWIFTTSLAEATQTFVDVQSQLRNIGATPKISSKKDHILVYPHHRFYKVGATVGQPKC